jgi:hypothetical protein
LIYKYKNKKRGEKIPPNLKIIFVYQFLKLDRIRSELGLLGNKKTPIEINQSGVFYYNDNYFYINSPILKYKNTLKSHIAKIHK